MAINLTDNPLIEEGEEKRRAHTESLQLTALQEIVVQLKILNAHMSFTTDQDILPEDLT